MIRSYKRDYVNLFCVINFYLTIFNFTPKLLNCVFFLLFFSYDILGFILVNVRTFVTYVVAHLHSLTIWHFTCVGILVRDLTLAVCAQHVLSNQDSSKHIVYQRDIGWKCHQNLKEGIVLNRLRP